MDILIAILIVVIIIIVAAFGARHSVVSVGPRRWHVAGGFDNQARAADILARTNSTIIEFLRALKKKYHIDEPDDVVAEHPAEHGRVINAPNDLHNMIDHLLDNYNPDVFFENDPRYTADTSYTLNKGDAIYICLRRRDNPEQFVDEDVLLFTMLHEMAHIANYRGWGHGNDFWACFKFILHEAQVAGIYRPVDYAKHPVDFCGLALNWNPLFDSSVPELWAASA